MRFSDFYDTPYPQSNALNQIDSWKSLEQNIRKHYKPGKDVTGHPAYSGLLLFKILLMGIWNGALSDEATEDMANSYLHVIWFLELVLGDDVPDHSFCHVSGHC